MSARVRAALAGADETLAAVRRAVDDAGAAAAVEYLDGQMAGADWVDRYWNGALGRPVWVQPMVSVKAAPELRPWGRLPDGAASWPDPGPGYDLDADVTSGDVLAEHRAVWSAREGQWRADGERARAWLSAFRGA